MDSSDRPTPISSITSSPPLHIVTIPYPGRGHINPMINLCRLLSPKTLNITIILTEEWLNLISSDSPSPTLPSNIRIRSIPNILPSERTRGNNYTEFFEAVMSKMADPVQRVFDELNPPADVVVADALLPWIVGICKKRDVPAVSLWTESASLLFALYRFDRLDAAGGLPEDFSGDEALSYLPNVSSTHIASLLPNATTFDLLRAFSRNYYWFHTAHSLLTTSFDKLESSVMDKIRSEFSIPIYQIGPLIPHSLLLPPSPNPTNPAPSSYLAWLDSQPESSVLYVSLGSFLPISGSQMEEIAIGLIQSKVKFFWVLRDKFRCVDENTGFVLPWCDQLRVLCHSSVGGFLTHCGWNSTLEAVYAGVPMITFPLFWDQKPNSKLVVDDWKIGLTAKEEEEEEEVVKREMMVKKVRKLMDLGDEESKGMRERAARLKKMCREALGVKGSSQKNLDEFLLQVSKRFN